MVYCSTGADLLQVADLFMRLSRLLTAVPAIKIVCPQIGTAVYLSLVVKMFFPEIAEIKS